MSTDSCASNSSSGSEVLVGDSVLAALVDEHRLSQMLMQISFHKIIRAHSAAEKQQQPEAEQKKQNPQQQNIHRNVLIVRMLQRARAHYHRWGN